ncbi:mucin-17-like [Anopheles bellator]|uniref:mucin-17-like n=1 Tax=Anopheles bellator TaxID=139047 RepID=UPI002649438E|nr:mucin-17-like [Anopheles bellator]
MRTSVFSLVVLCSVVSATVAKHRALTRDDLPTGGIITPPAPKQDGPTTAKPLGLILLPFPQAANNVQSLVDISPETIAAIQSGDSPYAAIAAYDDPSDGSSTTSSAPWSAPSHVPQFSAFLDKIQAGSSPPRPSKPNSIAQLGIFAVTPASTSAPASGSTEGTQHDPFPTNLQGLGALCNVSNTLQTTFTGINNVTCSNATNTTQSNVAQLGTIVQSGINNFFGISRPANDEPVTSTAATTTSATTTAGGSSSSSAASTTTPVPGTTAANATTNPFDSFVSSVQSSLTNPSAAAQVVTGQVGSNVQSGLASLLQVANYRPNKAPGTKDATSPVQGVFGRIAATDGTAVVKSTSLECNTCAPGQDVCSPGPGLRIVNGKEVNSTTEFPFLVLITYQDSPSGQGALINDRWFVTTAHIVDSLTNIGLIRAVVNTLVSRASGPSDSRRIASKLSHPNYVTTNLFANNVGLMALEKPFTTFTPVCLPSQATFTSPPTMATVVGWGTTTPGGHGPSVNLQAADLLMFPSIVCQQSYPQVSSQNLCGGSIKPSPGIPATCAGDGGDPLVFREGSAWKLLGVALDIPNVGCQNSEQLSVFTDVAPFTDWINANAPGCKCGEVAGGP